GKFNFEPPFTSFDPLVGGGDERRRDGEAKHPGGLVIDDQLELRRLHDRKVCGLGTLEDARGIDPNPAVRIRQARPVAHQPADFGKRAIKINRRDREARCEVDQLDAPGEEEGVGVDEKRVGALARKRCEGHIDLAAGVGVEHLDLQPHGARTRCVSLTVDSEVAALEGLTSTATRVAAGTISRRSSRRFAANSIAKLLIPVKLPPRWARLATRPSLTGSSPTLKAMGIVVVAALAATAKLFPNAAITATRW